jgi:hypothetical protein
MRGVTKMLATRWYAMALAVGLCALPRPGATAQTAVDTKPGTTSADERVIRPEAADEMGTSGEAVVDTTYPLVQVKMDGKALATKALLMNGRTLLPVRELVEGLGGEVRWDSHQKTVWAAFPSQERTVRMLINAPVAEIYAYDAKDPHKTGKWIESIRLDQPPVLLGGRVVAPVAAAAAVAGAKVFWDPQAKIVSVESPPGSRGTAS